MRGEADVSDDLNAEIARLTAEVEQLKAPTGRFLDGLRWRDERMLVAEATAARYAEALRQISEESYDDPETLCYANIEIARAALASQPAPVVPETQEDEPFYCPRCGVIMPASVYRTVEHQVRDSGCVTVARKGSL